MGRVSDARKHLMDAVAELFWTGSYDSTTIEQICDKAGVKKGTFYYFFEGKAALAEAALDAEWRKFQPQLDAIFSASVPPLERILRHCELTLKEQAELKAQHGCVLGCPLCTLGTEISTQEKGLQKKVQEIMAYSMKYLETAIRDAHAAGLIHAPNARMKAGVLHAYHLGLLTQARIHNDLAFLDDLPRITFDLLGAKLPKARRKLVTA